MEETTAPWEILPPAPTLALVPSLVHATQDTLEMV